MNIGLCFILMNTVGWLMWENRLNYELVYESIAAILYFCVIVSMLNWDGIEDGNYKVNGWLSSVSTNDMVSHSSYKKL
jgi:hypothetical protein